MKALHAVRPRREAARQVARRAFVAALVAFAIRGGHLYLNLGVFQVADQEGEVLGILAHEIGHIVGRHGAKQIVKQQWASIAMTTAIGGYPNYYAGTWRRTCSASWVS